jgi:hypothetical protein
MIRILFLQACAIAGLLSIGAGSAKAQGPDYNVIVSEQYVNNASTFWYTSASDQLQWDLYVQFFSGTQVRFRWELEMRDSYGNLLDIEIGTTIPGTNLYDSHSIDCSAPSAGTWTVAIASYSWKEADASSEDPWNNIASESVFFSVDGT